VIPFLIIVGSIGWLLAAAGWIVVRARAAGQAELRERIADLQLQLGGVEAEREELARLALGVEVAHDLARQLAAVADDDLAKVVAAATPKRAQQHGDRPEAIAGEIA
jgi:hypothetical protein